jgi:hypothetical protein
MARGMMPMRMSGDGGKNTRGHRGEPGLTGQRLDGPHRLRRKKDRGTRGTMRRGRR